jgi:hypothetical protein
MGSVDQALGTHLFQPTMDPRRHQPTGEGMREGQDILHAQLPAKGEIEFKLKD